MNNFTKKITTLLTLVLAASFVFEASAIVSVSSVPTVVVENTVITIKGRKLNSANNPFTATLVTEDGK